MYEEYRERRRRRYTKKEREKERKNSFYLMSIPLLFRNLPLYKS
jgi:hypothetical protein